MKRIFIAWTPFNRRSELIAKHLEAEIHYIFSGRSGRILKSPFKYLSQGIWAFTRYPAQTLNTWRILREEQADIIIVQNPPIICALIVYLFTRRYKSQFVIDSHTGAFLSTKWRWSLGLHRILSSHAFFTIVHNKNQGDILKQWECPYFILGFTPGCYSQLLKLSLNEGFNIAMISSFEGDEPHDVVFNAAKLIPDVNIYVTGDYTRASHVVSAKPKNCHLTGYLTYDQYIGLLREVDIILVLTTVDHQLLSGGFEAVSLGKPLIVSNWPILKEYFNSGTVHVPNTGEGIYDGIRRAQGDLANLQNGIIILRDKLNDEWETTIKELHNLLESGEGNFKSKPNSRISKAL